MLKAFGPFTDFVQGEGSKRMLPTWTTVLASRLLLTLQRAFGRAIGEMEQSKAPTNSEGLGLASVLSSVVVNRITQMLQAQGTLRLDGRENLRATEKSFVGCIADIFGAIQTPVGDAIAKV